MEEQVVEKLTYPAIASIVLTVIPLFTTSLVVYYIITHEPVIAAFNGWEWLLVTIVCSITSTISLTLPTFLALVFGYFLSWKAVPPLLFLNMVAIILVYVIVHWLDHDQVRSLLERNPKVRNMLTRIREQEIRFIFFAKLSPILPFAVTNIVFALSGARLRNILVGGFLGMVPRTVLAIWTGSQAREIRTLLENPNEGTWTKIAFAVLLLVSIAGLFSVLKRALSRAK